MQRPDEEWSEVPFDVVCGPPIRGTFHSARWLEVPLLNGYLFQVNQTTGTTRHSAKGDVTGAFWFPGSGPTPTLGVHKKDQKMTETVTIARVEIDGETARVILSDGKELMGLREVTPSPATPDDMATVRILAYIGWVTASEPHDTTGRPAR